MADAVGGAFDVVGCAIGAFHGSVRMADDEDGLDSLGWWSVVIEIL